MESSAERVQYPTRLRDNEIYKNPKQFTNRGCLSIVERQPCEKSVACSWRGVAYSGNNGERKKQENSIK